MQSICQVLKVSRSGYYSYKAGESHQYNEEKKYRAQQVKEVFHTHKRRYVSRRIMKELQASDIKIGRYQVRSLMKDQDLIAIQPKSFVPRTTDSRHGKRISPNLLLEGSLPNAPNKVWVSDITYLPLVNGNWAYLATWLDLFSGMIVGWQVDNHMEDELVINALDKGLSKRKPSPGLITHFDRGEQYVSTDLKKLLKQYNCQQSMSRADDPYDNAFAESFFSRFKAELLEDGAFLNVEDAQTEIFEFIEIYYNRIRRHSSLSYQSPIDFEQLYYVNLSNHSH